MLTVTDAVMNRISTRAFLPTPLARKDVASLLRLAQRAPSGGNLQPWRVIAVSGKAREDVIALAAKTLGEVDPAKPWETDRPVYPDFKVLDPVYNARRKAVGEMMYEALAIPHTDRAARIAWFNNNYRFFDAPVGLFLIIDTRMGHGQWAHMGMFMQTIALLAEERGWGTCMQECWARLRPELATHFGLDADHMVYAGMALGAPDPDAPVNQIYTDRAPEEETADFRGFPD
jgi:nitroreductase